MRSAGDADGDAPGRALDRTLFGVTIAISAYVLLWPSPPSQPLFAHADKLVHAVVFLALAWSGVRAGVPLRALGSGLIAYAIASEVIQQTLLADRQGDWTDVVADLVGAAIGVLAARPWRSRGRAG